MCAVAEWFWPSLAAAVGIPLALVVAPWGRGLGERVTVSVLLVVAGVALVFTGLTVTNRSLGPDGWRLTLSVALVSTAVVVAGGRRGRVLPVMGGSDLVGLVSGAIVAAMVGLPFRSVSPEAAVTTMLQYWDNTSHLVMLNQVGATGSWNTSGLGEDVAFPFYPQLHVALWSVAEWVTGSGLGSAGYDSVGPYVMWSAVTLGVAVTLLCWSAASVAGTLIQGSRTGRARVATFAATFVGLWCTLGSLGRMWDYGFANFLLAAALTTAGTTVALRSPDSSVALGWLAIPAAAVGVVWLYPPLALGLVPAGVVVLARVRTLRPDRLAPALVAMLVGAMAAVAPLLAVIRTTAEFDFTTATGGFPAIEWTLAAVLAASAVLVLLSLRHRVGLGTVVGLLGPVVASALLMVYFGSEYYAVKMRYAMLLAAVPLVCAAVAAWAAGWVERRAPDRRGVSTGYVVEAAVVTTALVGVLGVMPAGTFLPVGVAATAYRSAAVGQDPTYGRVVLAAADRQSPDPSVTTVWGHGYPGWAAAWPGTAALEGGRTAAGLGSVLTGRRNRVISAVGLTSTPAATLDAARTALTADTGLRLHLVVPDEPAAAVASVLVAEFGAERVAVSVAR